MSEKTVLPPFVHLGCTVQVSGRVMRGSPVFWFDVVDGPVRGGSAPSYRTAEDAAAAARARVAELIG